MAKRSQPSSRQVKKDQQKAAYEAAIRDQRAAAERTEPDDKTTEREDGK